MSYTFHFTITHQAQVIIYIILMVAWHVINTDLYSEQCLILMPRGRKKAKEREREREREREGEMLYYLVTGAKTYCPGFCFSKTIYYINPYFY